MTQLTGQQESRTDTQTQTGRGVATMPELPPPPQENPVAPSSVRAEEIPAPASEASIKKPVAEEIPPPAPAAVPIRGQIAMEHKLEVLQENIEKYWDVFSHRSGQRVNGQVHDKESHLAVVEVARKNLEELCERAKKGEDVDFAAEIKKIQAPLQSVILFLNHGNDVDKGSGLNEVFYYKKLNESNYLPHERKQILANHEKFLNAHGVSIRAGNDGGYVFTNQRTGVSRSFTPADVAEVYTLRSDEKFIGPMLRQDFDFDAVRFANFTRQFAGDLSNLSNVVRAEEQKRIDALAMRSASIQAPPKEGDTPDITGNTPQGPETTAPLSPEAVNVGTTFPVLNDPNRKNYAAIQAVLKGLTTNTEDNLEVREIASSVVVPNSGDKYTLSVPYYEIKEGDKTIYLRLKPQFLREQPVVSSYVLQWSESGFEEGKYHQYPRDGKMPSGFESMQKYLSDFVNSEAERSNRLSATTGEKQPAFYLRSLVSMPKFSEYIEASFGSEVNRLLLSLSESEKNVQGKNPNYNFIRGSSETVEQYLGRGIATLRSTEIKFSKESFQIANLSREQYKIDVNGTSVYLILSENPPKVSSKPFDNSPNENDYITAGNLKSKNLSPEMTEILGQVLKQ